MKITSLGHASLLVESGDERVFVDPVFDDGVLDGAVCYAPARHVDRANVPRPTAIIVTHAHFDHFNMGTLALLPRDVPILTPEDDIRPTLEAAGFHDVRPLTPWRETKVGSLSLYPTPSDHGEPECGVAFRDASGTFWHMADGEVTPRVAHRLREICGRIDVVAAKYQPVVRASMGYLRASGPQFDDEEVVRWLETAATSEASLVFPFACGVAFAREHAWFNRYAFPLSPEDTVAILARRMGEGRAKVVRPGDVVAIEGPGDVKLHAQGSSFVRMTDVTTPTWEPVNTTTLTGVATEAERATLVAELARVFEPEGPFLSWLRDEVARDASLWSALRRAGVVWQLVVHAGEGVRLSYFVDFRATPTVTEGVSPEASSFTHLGGGTLLAILLGKAPPLLFWLAGQARSYDKVFYVEDGALRTLDPRARPQHKLGDPLTFFLRHGGSPEVQPHPAHDGRSGKGPASLERELFDAARTGIPRSLSLLCELARAEAFRRGTTPATSAVRETSDAFRRRHGLLDEADLRAWWKEAGLDEATYTEIMTGITAARALDGSAHKGTP